MIHHGFCSPETKNNEKINLVQSELEGLNASAS